MCCRPSQLVAMLKGEQDLLALQNMAQLVVGGDKDGLGAVQSTKELHIVEDKRFPGG